MPILTPQQLARLYDSYSDVELTFSAQVIRASGLMTSQVYFKAGEEHVPCVLYAVSMKHARLIAELGDKTTASLARSDNLLSLRLAFRQPDEPQPVTFFVGARAESFAEYNPLKPRVKFMTLVFTSRPSDALIMTLGLLLELKKNAEQRREERIILTDDSMRIIGLSSKESCVAVNGATRRCILRDISFGGARVLMSAQGSPREPQKVVLKLTRCELRDDAVLDGNVVRVEPIEGRTDLVALSIRYLSEPPISYRQRINSYFTGQGARRA